MGIIFFRYFHHYEDKIVCTKWLLKARDCCIFFSVFRSIFIHEQSEAIVLVIGCLPFIKSSISLNLLSFWPFPPHSPSSSDCGPIVFLQNKHQALVTVQLELGKTKLVMELGFLRYSIRKKSGENVRNFWRDKKWKWLDERNEWNGRCRTVKNVRMVRGQLITENREQRP